MESLTRTGCLIIGVAFGIVLSAAIAGWILIFRHKGFDKKLTEEEIRKHVNETWGE